MHRMDDIIQNRQLWTLKASKKKPAKGSRIKTEKKIGLGEAHFILCKNCGNRITSMERIISVDGQHTHRFTNQAGVTYEIGCFSSTDGCIVYGSPTLDFTWFEGFSWSFTSCSNCLIHLGWYYQSGREKFFGLIVELLVETTTIH